MATDFASLLADWLPGVYLDWDDAGPDGTGTNGILRRFLGVVSAPLEELQHSIEALYGDLFLTTCRPDLIPFVAALVGVSVDPSLPELSQRDQVLDALNRYRESGTAAALQGWAEDLTQYRVTVVDFSERLGRTPTITGTHGSVEPGAAGVACTTDVRDRAKLHRIGRVDDRVTYSADLRSPRDRHANVGRHHPDNVAFFVTPARVMANRRPLLLIKDTISGRQVALYSFDDRAGSLGLPTAAPVRLFDGRDGALLIRDRLTAAPDLMGHRDGVAIRLRGRSIFDDPDYAAHVGDLTEVPPDLAPGGPGPMVMVDPQCGRFCMLAASGADVPTDFSVDYLLAPATRREVSVDVASEGASVFSVDPDRKPVTLVDAYDGYSIAQAVSEGQRSIAVYHQTPRGWELRVNGIALTPSAELADLAQPGAPGVTLRVDAATGRFQLPTSVIAPGADTVAVTVAFSCIDERAIGGLLGQLAVHAPEVISAGLVPVVIDTRPGDSAAREGA